MWIQHLIERITKIYEILVRSSLIDRNDIQISYEKFVQFAENIQKHLYQNWWTVANDLQPKKLLQKAFLKPNQFYLQVNFDPQIIIALSESLWWIRLNYEIPYSLIDVYNTRKTFREIREETNEFVRKYNRAIDSLQDKELCLFEERIRMIMKKLQSVFQGKINYLDENTFQEFIIEINRHIDQVRRISKLKISCFSSLVYQYDCVFQRNISQLLYEVCEYKSTTMDKYRFRKPL